MSDQHNALLVKLLCLLPLAFLAALVACTPTKEEVCSKIDEAVRANMEDIAETYQLSLAIFDIKTVAFDTINENQLDRMRLATNEGYTKVFWNKYQDQKERIEEKLNEVEADQKRGVQPTAAHKMEMEDAAKRMIILYDSLKHYLTIDSTLQARIKTRQDTSKTYLYSRTYNKYRLGGKLTTDTSRYVIDEKYKVVRLMN
ncbi:hypothetical protein QE390_002163 [Siphonobacter sp. SORGH_AS 1065]|nr:hypothetical protein [Siphonobacter sp. SORGH_AS_1065]